MEEKNGKPGEKHLRMMVKKAFLKEIAQNPNHDESQQNSDNDNVGPGALGSVPNENAEEYLKQIQSLLNNYFGFENN